MKLVITSEAEAWKALKRATSGEKFPDDLQIEFKGWPNFQMDVKGRDWNSTVPTRIMKPLLDVQRDINRAYASIKYNDFSPRKLKDDERDELEVVVKVNKGSSIFNAELWKQFTSMAEAAVGRMSGNQIVTMVIGVALVLSAPTIYKDWVASRQAEKSADVSVKLSQQETERMKIFSDAMNKQPPLQTIQADSQETHNRLLKAIRPGDTVDLKGVKLGSSQVFEIVQPERERSADRFIHDNFIILGNKTDMPDGFRITVKSLTDSQKFNADVPSALPASELQIIQKAEWTKKPIRLRITASVLRDTIVNAKVGAAETINSDE